MKATEKFQNYDEWQQKLVKEDLEGKRRPTKINLVIAEKYLELNLKRQEFLTYFKSLQKGQALKEKFIKAVDTILRMI